MKRPKLVIYLLLILMVITGFYILPFWIDGYFFKKYYMEIINASNLRMKQAGGNVSLILDRYDLGIHQSEAKLRLVFTDPETASMIPNGISLDTMITHGPILKNEISQSYQLAFATVTNRIYLPEMVSAMLTGQKGRQWLIDAYSTILFGGYWQQRLRVNSLNLPYVGKLTINDSNSEGKIHIVDNQFNLLQAKGRIGAISLKSPEGIANVNIQPMEFTQFLEQKTPDDLQSKQTLLIPGVTAESAKTGFNLQKLSIHFSNEITRERLYNGYLEIKFDLLNTTQTPFALGPFKLAFTANRFNKDGLDALKSLLEAKQERTWTAQDASMLNTVLSKLFTAQSSQLINLSFNSSNGSMSTQAEIKLNPVQTSQPNLQTIPAWLEKLNITINIKISNSLLMFAVDQMLRYSPYLSNQSDANTLNTAENVLHRYVADLLQQGKLSLNQSLDILELSARSLSVDQFSQQAYQIVKPEDAPQLVSVYAQMLKEESNKASSPSKYTMTEKVNLLISQWQSQGYLTKSNDDYQTVITIDKSQMLVNGKTLDKEKALKLPPPAAPIKPTKQYVVPLPLVLPSTTTSAITGPASGQEIDTGVNREIESTLSDVEKQSAVSEGQSEQ